MDITYEKFLGFQIDLAPVGVSHSEENFPYFCTPQGAEIIGWAGVDGIHYCFIPGFGEMVFSVSPMELPPNYVRPLARSFEDFLRLLLACKDANLLEQAWQWPEEALAQAVEESESDASAQDTLERIAETTHLTPMEHPWVYMRALQEGFDDSKIQYTEDFYDPDMNPNAPSEAWAVSYEGTIYNPINKGRAGTEIPVNREFQLAGRRFLVPAVYVCDQGMVVDLCMQVELGAYRQFMELWYTRFEGRDGEDLNRRERLLLEWENPLCFDFEAQLRVNGERLTQRNGSSVCYLPGDPSEEETQFIAEHYHLDLSAPWCLFRRNFPWKNGRQPEIQTLELTMRPEPTEIPGGIFEASRPGEQIDLHIPGHPCTLTVVDVQQEILDTSMMATDGLEYPDRYAMLTYTLSPQPEADAFYLQDLAENDQPRPRQGERSDAESCEAAALSIIGGADGPIAMVVGAPQTETVLAACSAPHFEPPRHIRWYPILRVQEPEPVSVQLIG